MNSINTVMDELITTVKTAPELSGIRFFKAYRCEAADVPADGITAVVELCEIHKTRGYIGMSGSFDCSAKYIIRVGGGSSVPGTELNSAVCTLLSNLRDADLQGYIYDWKIGRAEYDKKRQAVFRELSLELRYCEASL